MVWSADLIFKTLKSSNNYNFYKNMMIFLFYKNYYILYKKIIIISYF